MAISDFEETLIILGLKARTMLLKIWLFLRIFSMSSGEICEFDCLLMYRIPTIYK